MAEAGRRFDEDFKIGAVRILHSGNERIVSGAA
jgi:hypothetical protein